jgi:O-antigen/teichoic acid export membrane protein
MNAVLFSQLYAPSIILTTYITLLLTIIKAKGLIKIQSIGNAIDTTFGLGINIVLIYFFGLYGLIGGVILSKIISLVVLAWMLFRHKQY